MGQLTKEFNRRNLDAFQGSENILNHHLHVDASRVVEVDGDAIPTGNFINVTGTPWDFRTPQKIDYRWNETVGLCGGGPSMRFDGSPACVLNTLSCRMRWVRPLLDLRSVRGDKAWCFALERRLRHQVCHGVVGGLPWQERADECSDRLDITTNNPATQVYTAYWLDMPRKVVHGGPSLNYTSFSGVAIEQEGYIDAINTPEWGVDQICECDMFCRCCVRLI